MIQAGCPEGTGAGGPGYSIACEFGRGLTHDRPGLVSMANRGPHTGGSQFFITDAETRWLDGKNAIFGEVVEGIDLVSVVAAEPRNAKNCPDEDITLLRVSVYRA